MTKIKDVQELKVGDVIKNSKLGKGEFVVLKSCNEVQSGCHNESNWNAWRVDVQKLRKDGTYNQKAKMRGYYDSYGFCDEYRLTGEVEVIRRLKYKKKVIGFKYWTKIEKAVLISWIEGELKNYKL